MLPHIVQRFITSSGNSEQLEAVVPFLSNSISTTCQNPTKRTFIPRVINELIRNRARKRWHRKLYLTLNAEYNRLSDRVQWELSEFKNTSWNESGNSGKRPTHSGIWLTSSKMGRIKCHGSHGMLVTT